MFEGVVKLNIVNLYKYIKQRNNNLFNSYTIYISSDPVNIYTDSPQF